MRKDKKEVLRLRKSEKSYSEIKNALGVPKSTLSDWLQTTQWSNKIKHQLAEKAQKRSTIRLRKLNKVYRRHLDKIYQEARNEAVQEFEYFKFHPLFISGIAIYWGEGDKTTKHIIKIANTDPLMIRLFVKFLCEIAEFQKKKYAFMY